VAGVKVEGGKVGGPSWVDGVVVGGPGSGGRNRVARVGVEGVELGGRGVKLGG
jgi:hypothetical protein